MEKIMLLVDAALSAGLDGINIDFENVSSEDGENYVG